jgi:hypothetical protein
MVIIYNMKIAILLFGKSYEDNYFNLSYSKNTIIDYKYSYDNYKEYIYKFFNNKGYDIDTYFSTNISNPEIQSELINKYNPIKYNFIRNKTNNNFSRNEKFKNVIELLLSENKIYDLVLITRFDLLFNIDFNESNIKFDKFNLVSILEKPNLICDNFYLFPYKYINNFYNVVNKNINISFHFIKNDIDNINGKSFVNYILSENTYIAYLKFYTIVRVFKN